MAFKRNPLPLSTVTNVIKLLSTERHPAAVRLKATLQGYCENPKKSLNDSWWRIFTEDVRESLTTLRFISVQMGDADLLEGLNALLPYLRLNLPYLKAA